MHIITVICASNHPHWAILIPTFLIIFSGFRNIYNAAFWSFLIFLQKIPWSSFTAEIKNMFNGLLKSKFQIKWWEFTCILETIFNKDCVFVNFLVVFFWTQQGLDKADKHAAWDYKEEENCNAEVLDEWHYRSSTKWFRFECLC